MTIASIFSIENIFAQDENQTDFILVMENASSNRDVTKLDIKGESFDQICPSHQCEVGKHTYTRSFA